MKHLFLVVSSTISKDQSEKKVTNILINFVRLEKQISVAFQRGTLYLCTFPMEKTMAMSKNIGRFRNVLISSNFTRLFYQLFYLHFSSNCNKIKKIFDFKNFQTHKNTKIFINLLYL